MAILPTRRQQAALLDNEDLVPAYGSDGAYSGEFAYNTDAPDWMAEETVESWAIDDGGPPEGAEGLATAVALPLADAKMDESADVPLEVGDGDGEGPMNLSLDSSAAGDSFLRPAASVENILLSPKGALAVAGISQEDRFASSPVASPGGDDWASFAAAAAGGSDVATPAPFAVMFPAEEIEEASSTEPFTEAEATDVPPIAADSVNVSDVATGESSSDPVPTLDDDLHSESTHAAVAAAAAQVSPEKQPLEAEADTEADTGEQPGSPGQEAAKTLTPQGKGANKVGVGMRLPANFCRLCLPSVGAFRCVCLRRIAVLMLVVVHHRGASAVRCPAHPAQAQKGHPQVRHDDSPPPQPPTCIASCLRPTHLNLSYHVCRSALCSPNPDEVKVDSRKHVSLSQCFSVGFRFLDHWTMAMMW